MCAAVVSAWPCSRRIPRRAVHASQAVAVIAPTATRTELASSWTNRLCRSAGSAGALRRIGLVVSIGQFLSHAVHGPQVSGVPRRRLDLLTQVHDMDVDGTLSDERVDAVGLLQQ